jgi:antitoxin (DNA-binding transcriptional repressor) of toxin-antitoxin stability system
MITMTSLEAQNRFGEMIDTSQREPVLITRRGRPVSIVFSPNGDPRAALYECIKAISEALPLRGDAAIKEFKRVTAPLDTHNKKTKLTEKALTKLLNAR